MGEADGGLLAHVGSQGTVCEDPFLYHCLRPASKVSDAGAALNRAQATDQDMGHKPADCSPAPGSASAAPFTMRWLGLLRSSNVLDGELSAWPVWGRSLEPHEDL